ncbi:P-loop containing nucleoside triphosphate hydrolase [Maioricimonas rarisocia]|uniref:P-loop containing nucleoside triphosphate hydrolase n=1 Tax=Maioricimonas rarisocia TaxID=2528026 RepID=A0A517Z0V7_9PLAN|nr:ABC transporter ATP-binding protein [Maioricimonas rarisocia]QDU36049.1 P-loop containing nucleoside triphosphate hydrolase [Maioricimonas rarisocia]
MSEILPMRTETAQVHLGAIALDKAYRKGQHRVPVLRGVDVSIGRGEFLSIVGQSGSGKSTLLHLLGLLDTPDMGEVRLEGQRIDDLPQTTRDELRNRIFGFVFQFYHLLPELTLLENVITPLLIRCSPLEYWRQRKNFRSQAMEVLEKMGLAHRIHHRPSELSGGEMQRAAIARALIGKPEVLLADEPTGNLDARTGQEIIDLLSELNEREKLTIIMVTHDDSIARQAERIVRLSEGRIQALEEAA